MPTPNLNLPTIESSMTADVPRDVNALANAVDSAVGNMSTVPTASKEVAGAITELFQSGVNGKNQLEAAVIAKEGTVSKQGATATFDELDTGIRSIPVGPDTTDATATAPEILDGETAYGPVGKIVGTMPNRGAQIIVPGAADIAIPAGYHSGAGKVSGVVVPVANVLAGTTIAGQAGTMPERTGAVAATGTAQWGNGDLAVYLPDGYYKGDLDRNNSQLRVSVSQIQAAEADLIAANILSGKNIFGLVGTLQDGVKPGNHILISTTAADSTNNNFWTKVKEIQLNMGGTYRISFAMSCSSTAGVGHGRIYRNGNPVGTERVLNGASQTTYTEDIGGWTSGDLVQVYVYQEVATVGTSCSKLELDIAPPTVTDS